jgi:hypothetical protein
MMSERATIDPPTRGQAAERLVVERLRAVVGPEVLVLDNVQWLLRERGAVRNGEADVVIGDPERGILVIEVKAGEIRRDGSGTWWAGPNPLDRSPFDQARDNKYALLKKLHELPDWPADLEPVSGHAVAFPDVDLDTMRGRLGLLGLDADSELVKFPGEDETGYRAHRGGRGCRSSNLGRTPTRGGCRVGTTTRRARASCSWRPRVDDRRRASCRPDRRRSSRRRRAALRRWADGESLATICRELRCSRASLFRWRARLNRSGIDGLGHGLPRCVAGLVERSSCSRNP